MRHKFRLLCVSLAVLWVASSAVTTNNGRTVMTTSTSTVLQEKTTYPPQTTLLPSQSVSTQNVSTNSNPDSSEQHFGRQGALSVRGGTGRVSNLKRNTGVKDDDYVCGCVNDWTCVCENPTGKVVPNPGYADDTTWTFEVDGAPSSSPILVKVYFFVSDVPQVDKDWILTIGPSTTFMKFSELRNKTEVYIMSNEEIFFDQPDYEIGDPILSIVLYYEALVPVPFTEIISGSDMSGIISYPANTSQDLGYNQQQRNLWIFDYPENYIIEMNLTKLDLGYRKSDLHWKNTRNDVTENDFLLVGLGTEIMESTDKVFYGHLDEVKTIRINHPSGHLVMYSAYHEQWAGGFEVSYAALEVTIPASTTTLAPTTTQPNLGVIPSTLAPIDGAQNGGNNSAASISFRTAVAGMATEYVTLHSLDVESPSVIESSDVIVHWMATCMQDACSEYCAAFNFSIYKLTKAGSSWAFSTDTLDLMIRDDKLQSYWKVINEDCEFCEEAVTVNWYVFGGVAAGAVLLAVIISLVVWKIKNIAEAKKSKQEIEQDLKQEELERRRRSSGDESMIGGVKGGARMSLPFGARGSVNSGHSSQDDEADDFPEHDPDLGYDNFGLGADLLNDNRARKFYSNTAFEPDTLPSDHIGYKQLHQATLGEPQPSTSSQGLPLKPAPILKSSMKKRRSSQETDGSPTKDRVTTPKKVITVVEEEDEESSFTDSDDSDGTVQFKMPSFGPKKQISIQADVHHPGDSEFGETVL